MISDIEITTMPAPGASRLLRGDWQFNDNDAQAFLATVPEAAQNDFWDKLRKLKPVFLLQYGHTRALEALAARTEVSFQQWYRFYLALKKGDWQAVLDKRICGPKFWKTREAFSPLPAEDILLYQRYCENNGRPLGNRAAALQMILDWRAGKIATTQPLNPKTGLPRGWGPRNLQRHGPTKRDLKAARQGSAAAALEGPFVFRTRKGLWVGSHYLIDDKDHDFFVNSFAEQQAGRPAELGLLDLYSAYKPFWVFSISTPRADGTKRGKPEIMTRYLLAGQFYLHGYSPRGTTIVSEHGTAAVRDRVLEILSNYTGGLIKRSESGMEGEAAHIGQYPGISRGNFRHKAALESMHNLEHNRLGFLPGQTGPDIKRRPAQLSAMLEKNDDLLALRETLARAGRPDLADKVQFDLLERGQFADVLSAVYGQIADERDHKLEGWVECGHVRHEMLVAGQWIDQALLRNAPPDQRELALSLIASGQVQTRIIRKTRHEVWQEGRDQLRRISGGVVCEILGPDLAVERKISKGLFEFEDAESGAGVFRFDSVVRDSSGRMVPLKEGETYQTFLNPFACGELFVRDARGRYLGSAPAWEKVGYHDVDGVKRALGRAQKRLAEYTQALNERHAPEAAARAARMEANATLADTAAGGPERRATNKALARADELDALALFKA